MQPSDTNYHLANITDGGLFERLATAVLRKSNPFYGLVSHPGINAEGKTVKSPVDGIAFIPGAVPPHMIVIHHTITAAKDLDGKWLHNPATVKTRSKHGKPTEPAGDVTKTAAIVADEKIRTPNLIATLVLTTNQDPDQEIVRNVHAAGVAAGLIIDIWPRSRIADFLDNNPDGQWLRRKYLGVAQERISADLLCEISERSLRASAPPDDPDAWVERELDRVLDAHDGEHALFIIAESGRGKSVACYKRLRTNLNSGAFSLVLSDDIVVGSSTLEHALEATLCRFHPTLAPGCGAEARKLGTRDRPLLITVEDINRSGRGALLLERIARWSDGAIAGRDSWQILCPVWPQVISSLSDDVRKRLGTKAVIAPSLSKEEGALAVQRRRSRQNRAITQFDAAAISTALGHDPLLIALHDPDCDPSADYTIGQFIESSLQRLCSIKQEYSSSEYRNLLRIIAKCILYRRNFSPNWLELIRWPDVAGHAPALRHLVQQGEIIRVTGHSAGEKLVFRHDRVREWVLADGIGILLSESDFAEDLASDPFYAEIVGLALASGFVVEHNVQSVIELNPLAGFCALRHMHGMVQIHQRNIVEYLKKWLIENNTNGRAYRFFKWEAARMLAECENQSVLSIAEILDEQSWNGLRARFRNGDLTAGITLCYQTELGLNVVGYAEFLDHVKGRYGQALTGALAKILCETTVPDWMRIGALRLAGHLAAPELSISVKACWDNDLIQSNKLGEYLWALAQCSTNAEEAAVLLKPAFDLWASLPDKETEPHKVPARIRVVEYGARWEFQKKVPEAAIPYFIERACSDELRWPITYIFEGVDHPDAVEFLVRELGRRDAELEGSGRFSLSAFRATDVFERRQDETGRGMSDSTRSRLVPLWQVKSENKYLLKWAFRFWSATKNKGDLELLRSVHENDEIFDLALWQRVRRSDVTAIPKLLEKILQNESGYWWQLGRHFWSGEMTEALDAALARRSASKILSSSPSGEEYPADWILSEMIINLPSNQGEKIILKHWKSLQSYDYYIMAALYIASPPLLAAVEEAVQKSDNPQDLFKFFSMRARRTRGNGEEEVGFHNLRQIEALIPYLNYLGESDIHNIWSACNKHGWYGIRKKHIDGRISEKSIDYKFITEEGLCALLDGYLEQPTRWVDLWVDQCLEAGWTLDQVLTLANKWCSEKKTVSALEILASALAHAGTRIHGVLIDVPGIEPLSKAESIKIDTEYVLRRRSAV